MSGDGPGASSFRTFLKPASSSQLLISLKLKVSPFSVLTSICTANISGGSLGPFVVHEPFGDGDGATGFERAESFLEHLAAAFFAFAVQDVAERRDVVTAAEICFQQIAFDEFEAGTYTELLRDAFCRWNHPGPVDCGHANARRRLGEDNAPDSRAGGKIENAYFVFRFREL